MRINKLSDNLTPLDEGIIFGINTESDTPEEIVVEVIDADAEEVVAELRLYNTTSTTLNIAPYIARLSGYSPATTRHTTFDEAPVARYKIRIDDVESEEVVVSVNNDKIGSAPALITDFPTSRRLAKGESDEVLFAAEPGKGIVAKLTANTDETLHLEYLPTVGISRLIISLEDFDTDIDSLDVALYAEDEVFARLHYTVAPPLRTATRLAWLSECGAIEHYSFPVSHKVQHSTEKQSVMTSRGICSAHHKRRLTISLCSRFEPRATLKALAQIISSPKVWWMHNGESELVEVTTTNVEYNLFGEPSFLHLDICLWQKEALW